MLRESRTITGTCHWKPSDVQTLPFHLVSSSDSEGQQVYTRKSRGRTLVHRNWSSRSFCDPSATTDPYVIWPYIAVNNGSYWLGMIEHSRRPIIWLSFDDSAILLHSTLVQSLPVHSRPRTVVKCNEGPEGVMCKTQQFDQENISQGAELIQQLSQAFDIRAAHFVLAGFRKQTCQDCLTGGQ